MSRPTAPSRDVPIPSRLGVRVGRLLSSALAVAGCGLLWLAFEAPRWRRRKPPAGDDRVRWFEEARRKGVL